MHCCAGLVSLTYIQQPVFGLPHMHPSTPARSHYIGHLSPEWDPQRYMASVTDLAEWHAAHHGSVPLIVNTCGWIKVGQKLFKHTPAHYILCTQLWRQGVGVLFLIMPAFHSTRTTP